ncbi:class I SAM-dependent methyltransferase [Paenibacillus sp. GCM10027626]|uniref:class I SAM-dependent methyltransferase n=1 Tax=Paenibacillus sp. GCM10027626 TaxID=3273411 RepID=UPI00363B949D
MLIERIRTQIQHADAWGWREKREGGTERVPCISFRDYMACCLYDDKEGYYSSGEVRIGRAGDFYTSSGIGTIFGEMLAAYIASLTGRLGTSAADIAEWGAGSGALSAQMLAEWRRKGQRLAGHYAVVDANPVHLREAARAVEGIHPHLFVMKPAEAINMKWRSNQADQPLIVIANELLDAFPVHRVARLHGRLWELGVSLSLDDAPAGPANGEALFSTVYMPLSDERIEQSLLADGIELAEGQETEVNLDSEGWLAEMSEAIDYGAIVIIDYGHEAAELTASHRMRGSFLCYSGHIAHDNPYLNPGRQDLTSHINFTACRRAAERAGWQVAAYQTQKQFLVEQGILQQLIAHQDSNPFSEPARRNRSIRQLLLSDGMSETFKVLTLYKPVSEKRLN